MIEALNVAGTVQDPAERRRQLFEDAPIAYHEIDKDGVIRAVNQAGCELLGYSREELIGHHVWEFVAVEQQQIARDTIARKVSRQEPLTVVEREFRHRDGRYLWLEIHHKLMENGDGEVVGIRAGLLDITERRKLETEIQRQHDWMRFVFRSVARAVITTDVLGHITLMNPAAEALTGYREQEALGRALEQICVVQGDCGERVDLISCILAGPVASNQLRDFVVVDRSGGSHCIAWTVAPIMNDDEVIVGAMVVVEKL